MLTTGPADRWERDGANAAAGGRDTLRQFLNDDPPKQSKLFVKLLETIYNDAGDFDDERYDVVFDKLYEVARSTIPDPNTPDSARSLRELRDSRSQISLYDVFLLSMQACEGEYRGQICGLLEPPPIANLIWNRTSTRLYKQGAIHACADCGQDLLLSVVLKTLSAREDSTEEKLRILFQLGPSSEYTPLGIAILKQRLDCVRTLASAALHLHQDYLVDGKVVFSDNPKSPPLLHKVLELARQRAAMEEAGAKIKSLEGEIEMLQTLIDICPRLLCQLDASGDPPVKLARNISAEFGFYGLEKSIREAVFNELEDPESVRKALYSGKEQGKEIGLVLSDFSYDSNHFEDFVNDLQSFNDKRPGVSCEFEETLLYMDLPNLTPRCDITILSTFLAWLNEKKKVSRIMKLKLPDVFQRYSFHFVCQNILRRFKVDHLDWMTIDIDFGCKTFVGPRNEEQSLKKLTFYSHGQREKLAQLMAAIRGMADSLMFQKVEDITISIVAPPDAGKRGSTRFRSDVEATLLDLIEDFEATTDCGFEFNKKPPFLTWDQFASKPGIRKMTDAGEEEVPLLQMTKDLDECGRFLGDLEDFVDAQTVATNPRLKHCVKVFKDQKVKVAIIDNGADQFRSTISCNIEYGMSFMKEGPASTGYLPWYTAADPHGTQMAYLIRNVNDWCRLYPLRAGSLREDIDADAAAKAILWAIDHEVDIISISWIVKRHNTALESAIQAASDAKILVFCATADVGAHSNSEIWPADYAKVITVSASNAYGLPLPVSLLDVHVMLLGDRVEAHGPKYMREHKSSVISGSSVATALAAGLASLCLFLARMANMDEKGDSFKDRDAMLWLFRQMQEDGDRVIVPALLFGNDFKLSAPLSAAGDPPLGLDNFKYSRYQDYLRDVTRPDIRRVKRRDRSRFSDDRSVRT